VVGVKDAGDVSGSMTRAVPVVRVSALTRSTDGLETSTTTASGGPRPTMRLSVNSTV